MDKPATMDGSAGHGFDERPPEPRETPWHLREEHRGRDAERDRDAQRQSDHVQGADDGMADAAEIEWLNVSEFSHAVRDVSGLASVRCSRADGERSLGARGTNREMGQSSESANAGCDGSQAF
jgi:hypothetical protein